MGQTAIGTLPLETSKYTLHIALTNLPPENASNFAEYIKENLFEKYKKDSSNYLYKANIENSLFNPLVYYIFGSYDIAFISLVDRFKFSQKLFVPPQNINEDTDISGSRKNYDQSAFQIITGLCPVIKPHFNPKNFFESKLREENIVQNRFVTICNLKLNNKLLIGNGSLLYDRIAITVHDTLKAFFPDTSSQQNYLIIQSFSWFELSVIFFSEHLDKRNSEIAKAIGSLRSLTLETLEKSCLKYGIQDPTIHELLENSMFSLIDYADRNNKDIFLFSDSHSYIGFRKECLEKEDPLYSEQIITQLKVQLKPGYLKDFKKSMSDVIKVKDSAIGMKEISKNDDVHAPQRMVMGKYDYVFQFHKPDIKYNLELIKRITGQNDADKELAGKIGNYARKMKTILFFEYPELGIGLHGHIDFKSKLKERLIDKNGIYIADINTVLKKLKISRLIRGKVIKIFYNFINTIQDSILFIFLLDFVDFISYLKLWIEKAGIIYSVKFNGKGENEDSGLEFVYEIENYLIKFIDIFQEGYQLRLLNSYQFEDINDFDLDFNSSPQQILSAYSSITREIQELFFPQDNLLSVSTGVHYNFPKSPIIQINLKNTVADAFSINYDIFHLITPEFIFFTIVKEILNKYRDATGIPAYEDIKKACNKFVDWIQKHKYFNSLFESGLSKVDVDNIFIDYIRLGIIFQFDYKLFYTWSWTYNLQNAAMYDSLGLFNEAHFKKELLRILIVGFLTDKKEMIDDMECPLPELYIYWSRYFRLYTDELSKIFCKEKAASNFKEPNVDNLKKAIHALYNEIIYKISDRPGNAPMRTIKNNVIDIKKDIHSFSKLCSLAFNKEKKDVIGDLKNGIPILFSKHSDLIFIFQLVYTYLMFIYEGNNCKVNLLRRCWQDGKPLRSFINKQNNDWYYNIDQMGGLFFTNNQTAREYFKIRNAMMVSLWHMGLILKKKHFFENI